MATRSRLIVRLEGQQAADLCGSEIAEILEWRMKHTNCTEFMTPTLMLSLINLLSKGLMECEWISKQKGETEEA